ncbi:MAG: presqualene diphosphate synthase HpnD [Actinomycetota bacterium]
MRQSGTSFYWGMRVLDRPRRLGMYAVYAFCREVDDIADEPGDPVEKAAGLAQWRSDIDALFTGGEPKLELAKALAGPIATYGLVREDFLAVIDGCEMDNGEEMMVRPPMAMLDLYCDRVACAVGRLSVRVFGDFTPRCLDVADHLGRALQLTNILRDVREDAERGRCYLPDEVLAAHGISDTDPARILAHPDLPKACRDIGELAWRHFDQAEEAMAECSDRAMRPARLMGVMYRDLLARLQRMGWAPPMTRVRIPSALKMWYVLRHAFS